MIYSYYPGCSLHGSAKEYDNSTKSICANLGIELKELPNWICCGASSGHSLDEFLDIALPAYNLKIAEEIGFDLVLPCAACYNRFKVVYHTLKEKEEVRRQMKSLINYDFQNNIEILNLIELIKNKIGLENVRSKVVKPLKGLKVVCYYGCLLVRPPLVTHFDNPEHPQSLDEIMEVIGAESLNWSFKTECCGGSLSLSRDDIVKNLVSTISNMAIETGAHIIVTACPLCMENLDMRQIEPQIPILYFTELLGLAFSVKETIHWMEKHIIDPKPILKFIKLLP